MADLALNRPYLLAITLHQPWAWAFRYAAKRIENREWHPRDVLRKLGRIKGQPAELKRGDLVAIHAGLTFDDAGLECLREMVEDGRISPAEPFPEHRGAAVALPSKSGFTMGAVDGVGTYWGAVHRVRDDSSQKVWRSSTEWAHVIHDYWPLPTPVPCRGRQNYWPLPADELEAVVHQWAKAMDAMEAYGTS